MTKQANKKNAGVSSATKGQAVKQATSKTTQKKTAKTAHTRFAYPCTFFHQRQDSQAPTFCVFAATAGEVLQWADIERLGPGVRGVQRRENPAKRTQIKNFLATKRNTIPAAVVIALDGVKHSASAVAITIPADAAGTKPGLVIDGQHRLLGISDYDGKIKVPVVAILNSSDEEKAFQFLVINNKGSKVSQNHIKALALAYNKKNLSARLELAKIALDNERLQHVNILNTANESPFKNRVKFPNTRGNLKKIVPEAFEKALEYIESLRLSKLEDPDVQRDFFVAIWMAILEEWGKAIFEAACKLTEKVGVICMTRFMVDRLSAMADIDEIDLDLSDLNEVQVQVRKLLQRQTLAFWNAVWKGSGYDTSIGHAKINEAIIRIFRNLKGGKEWETEVDILSKGTV